LRLLSFISVQILFILFIKTFIVTTIFQIFRKKIKNKLKSSQKHSKIKSKTLKEYLQNNKFRYLGIREESLFKIFRLSYDLFESEGVFCDIYRKNSDFYYFSFIESEKTHIYITDTLQINQFDSDKIKVINSNFLLNPFIKKDKSSREEIFNRFYESYNKIISKKVKYSALFGVIIFLAQLIYFILDWFIL
jgi:ABC-type multidrug transport system fused ATPase/permease subunit